MKTVFRVSDRFSIRLSISTAVQRYTKANSSVKKRNRPIARLSENHRGQPRRRKEGVQGVVGGGVAAKTCAAIARNLYQELRNIRNVERASTLKDSFGFPEFQIQFI